MIGFRDYEGGGLLAKGGKKSLSLYARKGKSALWRPRAEGNASSACCNSEAPQQFHGQVRKKRRRRLRKSGKREKKTPRSKRGRKDNGAILRQHASTSTGCRGGSPLGVKKEGGKKEGAPMTPEANFNVP